MPENWPGMTGDQRLVRIGARLVGGDACEAQRAAKARPALWPATRTRIRKPHLSDFALGPVMDAIDEVEFNNRPLDEVLDQLANGNTSLHPAALDWVRHSAGTYLDGAAMIETEATEPVRHNWVAQRTAGSTTWELYAWGRRYQSADGTVREFRFLRFGAAGGRDRDLAEVGLAAYTAAHGSPAPEPVKWSVPFQIDRTEQAVRYMRILEVGLLDGSHKIFFEGTSAQAEDLYKEHTRDQVRVVTAGKARTPGYDCADCKLITACGTLPRIPGLLGISDPAAPLRTWSVSNGRYYERCPAQDHLMRLHLPKENEYTPEAERGQAVHEWLAEKHRSEHKVPCTVRDVPETPDDWRVGKWHVTGDQARCGAQMLASHADVCLFHRRDQITELRPEPELAFHDTSANVIIIAKPDMLYLDDGAWVWRETKTRQGTRNHGADIFTEFPQVALAVALLSENALGGENPSGARIELELLTPDCGDVLIIDPHDPEQIVKARGVVNRLAAPWHADETAQARPGRHCARCPVRRWCPDAEVTT